MKSYILTLALMVFGGTALAQTTYTGIVVDTKGQPMPGAKVQVKGTNESVLTNMDGTYTITTTKRHPRLTTDYAGWNPRRVSAKSDQVIKMKKTSWWNAKPDHWQFFLGADVVLPHTHPSIIKGAAPGIMLGAMKKHGFYVKSQFNGISPKETYCNCWTTGQYTDNLFTLSAGAIFRLGCPLHLYLGGGGMIHDIMEEKACGGHTAVDDSQWSDTYNTLTGGFFDAGLMLRGHHWFASGGVQYNGYCAGVFGVGYIF